MAHVLLTADSLSRTGSTHTYSTTDDVPAGLSANSQALRVVSFDFRTAGFLSGFEGPYPAVRLNLDIDGTSGRDRNRRDLSAQFESKGHILVRWPDAGAQHNMHFVIPTDLFVDTSENYAWYIQVARRSHYSAIWDNFIGNVATNKRVNCQLGLWDALGDTPTWHPDYVAPVVTAVSSFSGWPTIDPYRDTVQRIVVRLQFNQDVTGLSAGDFPSSSISPLVNRGVVTDAADNYRIFFDVPAQAGSVTPQLLLNAVTPNLAQAYDFPTFTWPARLGSAAERPDPPAVPTVSPGGSYFFFRR